MDCDHDEMAAKQRKSGIEFEVSTWADESS